MPKNSLDSIANYKMGFSKSDSAIYKAIKDNWKNIESMNIGELAKLADVSWGSISKFFKKYGFDGWKGFKQAAFVINNSTVNTEIEMATALQEELSSPRIIRGIKKTSEEIQKRKTIIIGSKHGKFLARDFAAKCKLINLNIEYTDYDSFDKHVTGDEWFIFISLSGKREEKINRYINYVQTSTEKKINATYISATPIRIENECIKYSIQPDKINFSWKYEKLIPRITLFGTALIIDKLFESIFDSDKEKHLKLLKIIKGDEK